MHSKLVQVPLAQTGEGIKECELVSWHVKVTSSTCSALKENREYVKSFPIGPASSTAMLLASNFVLSCDEEATMCKVPPQV